ncbi:hypothetical protein [Bacillus sp. FSL H8-0515]|uniref:hypothetical protein n=1 Tax=Bacillus sp. FSL H8-0515 TaxID=2921396 RepID=UPI002361336A
MKIYRLGYGYLFLTRKPFKDGNDFIGAMSINVLFRVFKDGEEIFFKSNDLSEQRIVLNDQESCYLPSLINCGFEKDNILDFRVNHPLMNRANYNLSLKWNIVSYYKELDKGMLESEKISEGEFMDIMRSNLDNFDNSDNRSAQSVAYFTQELEKAQINPSNSVTIKRA